MEQSTMVSVDRCSLNTSGLQDRFHSILSTADVCLETVYHSKSYTADSISPCLFLCTSCVCGFSCIKKHFIMIKGCRIDTGQCKKAL